MWWRWGLRPSLNYGVPVNIFQDLTLLPISKKCAAPFGFMY